MPRMMDELTQREKDEITAIDERYMPLLRASHEEVTKALAASFNATDTAKKEGRPLNAEETAAFATLEDANEKHFKLNNEWREAREDVKKLAETRLFDSYEGNVNAIIEMIKSEVPRIITLNKLFAGDEPTEGERAKRAKQASEQRQRLLNAIAEQEERLENEPDNEELYKSTKGLKKLLDSGAYDLKPLYDVMYSDDDLRESITNTFAAYFSFLKSAEPKEYKSLVAFVEACIADKNRIAESVLNSHADKTEYLGVRTTAVTTEYPSSYLAPTDKVSHISFYEGIQPLIEYPVRMEARGSKKKITTYVTFNFDELKNIGLESNTTLTPYDREVHDAIVTLYVVGGNEYMTMQMIYQVMTGNPHALLNPKQAQAISDSITKCMGCVITIRADEEAKAYGYKEGYGFKRNLISGDSNFATLNGTKVECLHVLRMPVLYEYAKRKNHISRADMHLLNTPVNKNEDTLPLQGYIFRNILGMKNGDQNRTLLYSTIYEHIGVESTTSDDAQKGALRQKKAKIRGYIKRMLNFWKKEGFIIDYTEIKHKTTAHGVTIQLPPTKLSINKQRQGYKVVTLGV